MNPTIYKYDRYNIFLTCYVTDQKLNQLQPTTTTTLITDTTTIQLQLQIEQLQPQMQNFETYSKDVHPPNLEASHTIHNELLSSLNTQ